jgi:hypothetical protein
VNFLSIGGRSLELPERPRSAAFDVSHHCQATDQAANADFIPPNAGKA